MGYPAVFVVSGVHGQEILLDQLTASDPCPCQQCVHGGHALGVHIKGKDLSESRAKRPRQAVNRPPGLQEHSNTGQADLVSCLLSGRVMERAQDWGLGVNPYETSCPYRSFQWPRSDQLT